MAPFRNRDRSNRSGRTQVEHNVLEGLPINQYKEVEVPIGQNPSENKLSAKDALWPELPMPRDSHMLPEHSQQLLRAARAGRVYKPPVPPEDEAEDLDEEKEHKEVPQGFTVKKWVKVARHLEEPEPEFLAKRRKGLPSQYAPTNGHVAPPPPAPTPLRETKVKKLDAEGNVTVYKALVPEGQTVQGEVQATDAPAVVEAAPAAAAPGTVIEGVGVANADGVVVANKIPESTPSRSRKSSKKKSRAGPGRKKKQVLFVEGRTDQGTPAPGSEPIAVAAIKREGTSVEPSEGGDTPMADAGDGEEGEDESEDDGEDRETPAKSATPAKATEDTEMVDAPPVPPSNVEAPSASIPASVVDVVTETAIAPVKQLVAGVTSTPSTEPVKENLVETISTTPKVTTTVDTTTDGVPTTTTPALERSSELISEPALEVSPQTTAPPPVAEELGAHLTPENPAVANPETSNGVSPPRPVTLSSSETAQAPEPIGTVEEKGTKEIAEKPLGIPGKETSSSPDLPLSAVSHSRQNSHSQIPPLPGLEVTASEPIVQAEASTGPLPSEPFAAAITGTVATTTETPGGPLDTEVVMTDAPKIEAPATGAPALEPIAVESPSRKPPIEPLVEATSSQGPIIEAPSRTETQTPVKQSVEETAPVEPTIPPPAVKEPLVEPPAPESVLEEPAASEPIVSEPTTSGPVLTTSVATDLAAPEPSITNPDQTKTISEEPPVVPAITSVEPAVVQPVTVEAIVEPITAERTIAEPVAEPITEPVVEPVAAETVAPEPIAAESVALEAVTTEPAVADPVTSEPAVTDSTSVESTLKADAQVEELGTSAAPTAPPVDDEPDLLGSLEAHLDKDNA